VHARQSRDAAALRAQIAEHNKEMAACTVSYLRSGRLRTEFAIAVFVLVAPSFFHASVPFPHIHSRHLTPLVHHGTARGLAAGSCRHGGGGAR
jgi:hypothetical protein